MAPGNFMSIASPLYERNYVPSEKPKLAGNLIQILNSQPNIQVEECNNVHNPLANTTTDSLLSR